MTSVQAAARRASHGRRRRLALCAIAAAPWLARAERGVREGAYPSRPVRLILPSTIGGTSDLVARLIATPLGDALGQPVVIEARPGAAGRIAVDYVAAAAPDGYTLLLANNATNAIDPGKRVGAGVAPMARFAPVTMLARLPIVVVVPPALGVHKLAELIARARRARGRLFYASGGLGSTSHIAAALLFKRAAVHPVHIPYAGTSMAVKDVLAGEVPVLFTHLGTVAALIHAGRLRALAVTGDHRMAEFPDVETVAEAGYPGFDVTTWHGVVAPEGTPGPVISRLQDELARIVALPRVRGQLAALGMEPVGATTQDFAHAIGAGIRQWEEVVRAIGGLHE